MTLRDARQRNRDKVDSGNRDWKITARPDAQGSYTNPVQWPMSAPDVTERGKDQYIESTREWAALCLQTLKQSGNI